MWNGSKLLDQLTQKLGIHLQFDLPTSTTRLYNSKLLPKVMKHTFGQPELNLVRAEKWEFDLIITFADNKIRFGSTKIQKK